MTNKTFYNLPAFHYTKSVIIVFSELVNIVLEEKFEIPLSWEKASGQCIKCKNHHLKKIQNFRMFFILYNYFFCIAFCLLQLSFDFNTIRNIFLFTGRERCSCLLERSYEKAETRYASVCPGTLISIFRDYDKSVSKYIFLLVKS